MDANFKNSINYLKESKKAAEHKPYLHRMLIKTYDYYINMAETEPENYLQKAGDMFKLSQSESLDRYANLFDLYKKLQYKELMLAHKTMFDAIKQSSSYSTLQSSIRQTRTEIEPQLFIESDKKTHLTNLMVAIIGHASAIDEDKPHFQAHAKKEWAELLNLDTEFGWQKLKSHPPYRNCMYYDDDKLNLIEKWWGELQ